MLTNVVNAAVTKKKRTDPKVCVLCVGFYWMPLLDVCRKTKQYTWIWVQIHWDAGGCRFPGLSYSNRVANMMPTRCFGLEIPSAPASYESSGMMGAVDQNIRRYHASYLCTRTMLSVYHLCLNAFERQINTKKPLEAVYEPSEIYSAGYHTTPSSSLL